MEDQIFFDNKFIFFQEKNKEDFFYGSLVYIVEHNSNGAIGIVVNKLISIDENQIFKSLGLKNNSNPPTTTWLGRAILDLDKTYN